MEAPSPLSVPPRSGEERIIPTTCSVNCDSRCLIRAHVKDGRIIRVSPGEFPGVPGYENVCLRGIAMPHKVHSDARVMYPLKRVGARGEGRFERISWEEALDTVAEQLLRVKDEFGPRSAAFVFMTGNLAKFVYESFHRFARCFEGTTYTVEALMSDHGASMGDELVYGRIRGGSDVRDYVNSRLIVFWGKNPTDTQMQDMRWIMDAKQRGAKLITIDPRMSNTAAISHQWIPIRPATDTALALGVTNVIISRGLHDEAWLKRNSCGPLLVRDEDGQYLRDVNGGYLVWDEAKERALPADSADATPTLRGVYSVNGCACRPSFEHLWSEVKRFPLDRTAALTGLSEDLIESFAIEYATTKPAAIWMAQGTQRIWNSHNPFRAQATLAAVCGYVGMSGGGASHGVGWGTGWLGAGGDDEGPPIDMSIWDTNTGGHTANELPGCTLYDHIETGEPYPIKFLWLGTYNLLNQGPDAKRVINKVIPKLSYIVDVDPYLNWTSKYADMVLPAATFFENWDLFVRPPWLMIQQPAIAPVGESRSDVQILSGLAARVGLGEYWNRTDEEWVRDCLATKELAEQGFDWEEFVKTGIFAPRGSDFSPEVDFTDGKFTTPTGRFEFYSERLKSVGHEVPIYTAPLEDPHGELGKRFPLVFLQFHDKMSVHSQHILAAPLKVVHDRPWLEMHPEDARPRGIKDDDVVEVFNDRGSCKVHVMLTEGIVPGCVAMPQGWTPEHFVEGHHQNLTHLTVNPIENLVDESNTAFYDVLVEVRRA